MISFDSVWTQIEQDLEEFKKEYRRTFLLTEFEKICELMTKDVGLEKRIRVLYLESYNKINTTKIIMERYLELELSDEDAHFLCDVIRAYLEREEKRKDIDINLRKGIYKQQGGKCALCCRDFLLDEMHADHSIPWKLVGDELRGNYQLLCEECNLKKGSKVTYKLLNIMKLT